MTATDGHHDTFFNDQKHTGLHDFRKRSLIVSGYAVRIVNNYPSILIERERWERIKGNFLHLFWYQDDCQEKFNQITHFSFKSLVTKQLKPLARDLTKKRLSSGLSPIELVVRS